MDKLFRNVKRDGIYGTFSQMVFIRIFVNGESFSFPWLTLVLTKVF